MASTRCVLAVLLASPALAVTGSNITPAQPALGLELTPDCHDGDERTVAQTEGPYFKPNAPLRRNLAADTPRGDRITIGGLVLDTACRPVPKTD
jgi:protocatechuate 3,4-dioxygenase beta subunit